MQEGNEPQIDRIIPGIDTRVDDGVYNLEGAYPAAIGLQERISGKTILLKQNEPINGILVFYNYYGRAFTILDINGSLIISETKGPEKPPWRQDVISGYDNRPSPGILYLYEDFEDYPIGWTIPFFYGGIWYYGIDYFGRVNLTFDHVYDLFETYPIGSSIQNFGFQDPVSKHYWSVDWQTING